MQRIALLFTPYFLPRKRELTFLGTYFFRILIAFGGLKETMKFPHLEGIELAIKNIVHSSKMRIA